MATKATTVKHVMLQRQKHLKQMANHMGLSLMKSKNGKTLTVKKTAITSTDAYIVMN